MADKTGRVPVVRTTTEEGMGGTWSTVPMAHSPTGFANLPYPWQQAKQDALKAHQAVKEGLAGDGKAAAETPTLPDLATRFGTESAPARQRHAELYHMLFHSWRDRPLRMLEIRPTAGPGGTNDAATLQLWLEYFPQGRVHALDTAGLPGLDHDRLTTHRADPEDGPAIRAALKDAGRFDIILDDASHASHYQQTAFLALFGALQSGGLYIIEDLRRQPEAQERPGITRTADLFRSYSETRRFNHVDPATEAAFQALAPEISGCLLFQVNFDKRRKDQIAVIQKR